MKTQSSINHHQSTIVIGLDIGGTKIMAASATPEGKIFERVRVDTPPDLSEGLKLLKDLTRRVSQGKTIRSIGAAIGGPLDWEKGIVSPLHQPQWRNVPLKEIMEKTFHCRFFVDVDTNVAALGEYHFGSVKVERLLYITISTGMGGGFLINGEIYRGKDGAHPEAGHQSVNFKCRFPARVLCECGASDCLEALVSGNGIRRIYQKPAEELSGEEWQEVGYNLGQGLRNLAAIYAPDVIVLGGGVTTGAGEKLLKPARNVLETFLKIVPLPEVRSSSLGYDSALLGAVKLAIKEYKDY